MKSPNPQPAPKPPKPVTVTAADQAQAARDQMRLEKKRFDWSKTILRPGGVPALPAGMKSTLS